MNQKDLLSSSKALLDLDADGALVPHGLGGHGRTCLLWCVDEIERLRGVEQDAVEWVEERTKRLRADNERLRAALKKIESEVYGLGMSRKIARNALDGK